MKKIKTRITEITVLPEGESLFSEQATSVRIKDRGAGEFVQVCENYGESGEISISPEQWPALREVIDRTMADILDAEAGSPA